MLCVVKMRCGSVRKCKPREGSPGSSREVGLPVGDKQKSPIAAERRKKPREDQRHGTSSRGKELRCTSSPTKRRKVIAVASSTSEEAEDFWHKRSMSEREQSLRFTFILCLPITNVVCISIDKLMYVNPSRVYL